MIRLDELVARLGGECIGDGATLIRSVAPPERAGEGDLAFIANPRYLGQLDACRASAVILRPDARERTGLPRILTPDPYLYYARVTQWLFAEPAAAGGVHPSAVVDSPVPASASIGANAVVGRDVTLGEGVIIGAGSVVGDGCSLGAGTRLYANVTLYARCVLGERCIIHSGAVLGGDGFGFARTADKTWEKIVQIGRVVLGNEVEIGANTTIDRGALDDTIIGSGCKIDNQIQIGHNVELGEHCIAASQVGISGSTRVGARSLLGGKAGFAGHLDICADVVISAGTDVFKSVHKPGTYTGAVPLQAHADWVKNFSHLRHLDALARRVKELEKRLAQTAPAAQDEEH